MTHARRTTATLACLVLALSAAVTSCASPVDGPSLVLTLATSETQQEPNAPEILMFAHEVDVRSAGKIRVDVAWDLTNPEPAGSDQVLARMVADGSYDLGVVPSRAWDLLGVSTLRAINTPFLITSDAAMRATLASDVRDDLLAGLSAAGVTGLDLWPGQLRRIFGIGEPVLRPADLDGAMIRSPRSRTVGELLESLGGTAVETPDLEEGTLRGLESSFAAVASAGYRVIATGNVVLFPRIETLVATDGLRARLDPGQWEVLADAAAAVRRDPPSAFLDDEEGAQAFCRKGGEIVAAGPDDVAAFEEVGRVVRADLERDPDTAGLVDAIQAAVSTVPPSDPITACPEGDTSGDAGGTHALDGVYLARVTRKDMTSVGITDPDQLRDNVGQFTWTLDNGLWSYHQEADAELLDPDEFGTYTYEDELFTLYWGSDEVITARLVIARNGTIRFTDLHDNLPSLQKATEGFFGQPWRRVSDLPG
jgi:TRAP-type C4-dicarboxylate transport system substrate-binding protein